ncbi:MAG: hypothetical protein LBD31_05450 [Treponema sp.]|jgi:hypothetical protein|nr:hypothetical protein [Treponema sp.]
MPFPGTMLILLIIFGLAAPLHGQDETGEPGPASLKNIILVDLNPELVALYFSKIDASGFGLELSYERMINSHFSLAGDIKTLYLTMSGMNFHIWEAGLNCRYYPAEEGMFFINGRLSPSWYQTPYHKGWMLSLGLDLGWKFIVKTHLVLEPYVGAHASSDDKFIMPFTITALSGHWIPGFVIGIRIGAGF